MRLVPPVINGHLVKREIGDAALCLEAVQNIPESLFDKIDAVDAKCRHRTRPAKAHHVGDQFRPQMAKCKGPGTDNRGVIRRDMAAVGGKISRDEVTILTLGACFPEHVRRNIDPVDHRVRIDLANGRRNQTRAAPDVEDGALRTLLPGKDRGDTKRVDVAQAGCIGAVVEFGEVMIEVYVRFWSTKAVCAVQEADTLFRIISIH